MQLISIGDVLLNLDQISVLDIDPIQGGAVVRVHTDSSQSVIEVNINGDTVRRLFDLVPVNMRLQGSDRFDI